MYRGITYTISCEALGEPGTKEQSYQAANEWWSRKKAEIDSRNLRPRHADTHRDVLEELRVRKELAEDLGAIPEAEELDQTMALVRAMEDEPEEDAQALHDIDVFKEVFRDDGDMEARIEIARKAGITIPDGVDSGVLDYLFGDRRILLDRDVRSHRPEKRKRVPEDRKVSVQIDRYVALEKGRVEGGQLSVSEFDTIKRCLEDFKKWMGEVDIAKIDAERIESWWSHVLVQSISVEYKKKKLRFVRAFTAWLVEKGLIPMPPNLHSRRHRFGGSPAAVPTIPIEDVKTLIGAATGQLKLHLLLMANCGMTQVDISDLHPSEVDWKLGRIRRKRSKTSEHKDVPIVDYPLWPVTFDLLKEHGHRDGKHALLTERGKPWVQDSLKADGKRSKSDVILSAFKRLKEKTGLDYPMKLMRKTSASLLETEAKYSRYATLFLGHSPRTIADKHYVVPDQKTFDAAVRWLGGKYGF